MPHKVSVILLSARLLCCWFVSMSSRRGTVCRVIWSILSPSGCISVRLPIYKVYPAMGTTLFPGPHPAWPIPKSPGKINLFSGLCQLPFTYTTTGISTLSTNLKKKLNIVFSHEVVNSLRASTQLEIPKPQSEHDAGCQVCIQNTRTIKLSDGH